MSYKIKSCSTLPFFLPLKKASSGFSVSVKVECFKYRSWCRINGRSVPLTWGRGWWNGSQWNHQTDLLLIDVGDHSHGGADHVHSVLAKQLELIVDELLPKAIVGPDDGPA